jgi:hypothetical protein
MLLRLERVVPFPILASSHPKHLGKRPECVVPVRVLVGHVPVLDGPWPLLVGVGHLVLMGVGRLVQVGVGRLVLIGVGRLVQMGVGHLGRVGVGHLGLVRAGRLVLMGVDRLEQVGVGRLVLAGCVHAFAEHVLAGGARLAPYPMVLGRIPLLPPLAPNHHHRLWHLEKKQRNDSDIDLDTCMTS